MARPSIRFVLVAVLVGGSEVHAFLGMDPGPGVPAVPGGWRPEVRAVSPGVSTPSLPFGLDPASAAAIVAKVWANEGGGRAEALVHWNRYEKWASVGILHAIWFPAGVRPGFDESFPKLVSFLEGRGVAIPGVARGACPWTSREQLETARAERSPEFTAVYELLDRTRDLQTEYALGRTAAARDRIADHLRDQGRDAEVDPVLAEFDGLGGSAHGVFALTDYVNWKGEGIHPAERIEVPGEGRVGWGLLQVLERLVATRAQDQGRCRLERFRDASRWVMERRLRNDSRLPADKHAALLARCDRYLTALGTLGAPCPEVRSAR